MSLTTQCTALMAISLYLCEGSSDKEYHVKVLQHEDGYVVNFRYGRRGSALATGSKTPSPISLDKATQVYQKLVKEKTAKGYTPAESGVPYTETTAPGTSTGWYPQLLNAIDPADLSAMLSNSSYGMQQKMDGERVIVRLSGEGAVTASNRRGLVRALAEPVAREIEQLLPADSVIDGELVGNVFWVFDVLRVAGTDMRNLPYRQRYAAYAYASMSGESVKPVLLLGTIPIVPLGVIRSAEVQRLAEAQAEGVVFKDLNAPYSAGRPSSGGPALEHKFTESCTCIVVSGARDKRSIALALLDDSGVEIDVGHVTVPPNQAMPSAGDLVEVRYLYRYENGSLFQPVLLGVRSDMTRSECTLSQITRTKKTSAAEPA